jgi:hypothetical protein
MNGGNAAQAVRDQETVLVISEWGGKSPPALAC